MTDEELCLDCAGLRWVDPAGLCLLRHLIQSLNERNVIVHLRDLPLEMESYMRRMDLFADAPNLRFDDRTGSYARNDLQGNLVELHDVTRVDDSDATALRIARTIVAQIPTISTATDPDGMCPSDAEKADKSIAYVFSELLDNALIHGRRRGYTHAQATVAAQYFPRRKRLQIAIVDDGCGLLQSLQSHPRLQDGHSHEAAIRLALEPRVSCNRDLRYAHDSANQGVGLTVSTRLALASGGEFTIYSGDSAYNEDANGRAATWRTAGWDGTGVFIEFCSERLPTIDVSQVVAALPGFRQVPGLHFQ
ncbi:ATP-binding protein [Pseudothauera rhizosphaerae]|nr:ATP-binding protein [Pseudothauera rhizosphaerae]